MLNSEEETRTHASRLRPLIDDTFAKFPLVVVGYSGEADKVFGQIAAAYGGKYRLYWLGFDEEAKSHLRALLDGGHKNYVHYYGGADADAILIALAQKLECFPPKAFSDPAAHLFEERTGIAEFPLGAMKYDLLKESQEQLQRGGPSLRLDEARLAALRGDSEKIFEVERATPAGEKSSVPPTISAWALISAGNALGDLAHLTNDEALYRKAIVKYEAALRRKPDYPNPLRHWGRALAGLARMKRDMALYHEAIGKFEAALRARPNYKEALEDLDGALIDLWEIAREDGLLDRARIALDRHEQLDARHPWQRARLAAVLGDEDGCRTRLLRAKDAGTLPNPETLKADPSLETMKRKRWFKQLLSQNASVTRRRVLRPNNPLVIPAKAGIQWDTTKRGRDPAFGVRDEAGNP
jgi:tetratricopeptide (TPR) repeat protein